MHWWCPLAAVGWPCFITLHSNFYIMKTLSLIFSHECPQILHAKFHADSTQSLEWALKSRFLTNLRKMFSRQKWVWLISPHLVTFMEHLQGKASEALWLGVSGQNILTLIIVPPAVRRVIFSKCTVLYQSWKFHSHNRLAVMLTPTVFNTENG